MSGFITPIFEGIPPHREESFPLRICLFGPMEVRVGADALPRLRSRKGLWLLALLALRPGRDVERDWLAGTLWPDSDEPDARRSLRQSLHDLRRALGPESHRLACESPRTLRLDVSGADVDVLAFDAALARGGSASLKAAVELYRGPLLEDCTEEWALEERRQREQAYLTALETLALEATVRGEYGTAAGYLRRAVGVDPFRENLQRVLMQSLGGEGNPGGALLVYRQFREMLRREMAAEPTEETTDLFRRIRAEAHERAMPRGSEARTAITTPPPISGSFPVPLTELIGRDEAVTEIAARLRHARLVTLTGTGGIGKTRLALQVAGEIGDEFRDGTCFVNLAPLADAGAVPTTVRAALGVASGDARQEPVEALRQFLAPRRLLLVLDNCEHLWDACAALAESLLSVCPGLRILATSRQALGLRGETAWRVPSLALPPPATEAAGHPSPPTDYAAVRLFVERARAADAEFTFSPETGPAVADICRRLDGIPLALELAAARVRSLSVAEISARLEDGFGLLAGDGPGLLPRQKTLTATFDWGWDLLSDSERILLRRLSVFSGGWTLPAAEGVCPGGGIAPGQVLDLLTGLVDKSLVVFRPETPGGARYHLLETIRQHAAARLRESEDRETTPNRHRDYFLATGEEIKWKLRGPEQVRWFRYLETEHDNFRAALAWCQARNEGEQELRLAVALSRFWDTQGYLQEGWAALKAALSWITPETPPDISTAALIHAGWMTFVLCDYPASRDFFHQALALLREYGDGPSQGGAINCLAMIAMEEGDIEGARTLYEESLPLCQEPGSESRIGSVLHNLGILAAQQGDHAAAAEYLTRSIAWSEAVGDRQQQGLSLCDLSALDVRHGRYAEAQAHCGASLRLLYESGATVDLPTALNQMACIAQAQGQSGRAACLLGASESLRGAMGVPLSPHTQAQHTEAAEAAKGALGSDAFAAAFAEGETLDAVGVVEYALGQAGDITGNAQSLMRQYPS